MRREQTRPAAGVARRDPGPEASVTEQHDDVHVASGVLGVDDGDARRRPVDWRRVSGKVQRHVVSAQAHGLRRPGRLGLHGSASEHLAVGHPSPVDVLAHQTVRHAQEGSDVLSGRPLVDPLRRVVLLDATGSHHGQPISQRQCLGLVVGHEDGGEPEPAVQLVYFGAHLIAQPGVEVAQRLVEQDEFRAGH